MDSSCVRGLGSRQKLGIQKTNVDVVYNMPEGLFNHLFVHCGNSVED